jgi:hypothetical protein
MQFSTASQCMALNCIALRVGSSRGSASVTRALGRSVHRPRLRARHWYDIAAAQRSYSRIATSCGAVGLPPACLHARIGWRSARQRRGSTAAHRIGDCRCVCTAAVGQALVLSLRVLGVEMPSPSVLMPKPLTFGHVAICVRACAAPGHTHTHTQAHTHKRTHTSAPQHARWRPRGTKTIRLLRHARQCTA